MGEPKLGYMCGGAFLPTSRVRHGSPSFPPVRKPPRPGPPFSVTGKPVARGRVVPWDGNGRSADGIWRTRYSHNATVLAPTVPSPLSTPEHSSLPSLTAYPTRRASGMAPWASITSAAANACKLPDDMQRWLQDKDYDDYTDVAMAAPAPTPLKRRSSSA